MLHSLWYVSGELQVPCGGKFMFVLCNLLFFVIGHNYLVSMWEMGRTEALVVDDM